MEPNQQKRVACFNCVRPRGVSKCPVPKEKERITKHLKVCRTANNIKGKFTSYNTNIAEQLSQSTTDMAEIFLTENLHDESNQPTTCQQHHSGQSEEDKDNH